MKPGVDDRAKVIQPSGPAPETTGKECGSAAVLVIQILHGCAELIHRMLCTPIRSVVTAKEVQIRIFRLQHRAELTEQLLLLLIGMLEFQDHTDIDVLGSEAQVGERAVNAAVGRAVLH